MQPWKKPVCSITGWTMLIKLTLIWKSALMSNTPQPRIYSDAAKLTWVCTVQSRSLISHAATRMTQIFISSWIYTFVGRLSITLYDLFGAAWLKPESYCCAGSRFVGTIEQVPHVIGNTANLTSAEIRQVIDFVERNRWQILLDIWNGAVEGHATVYQIWFTLGEVRLWQVSLHDHSKYWTVSLCAS